MVRIVTAEEVNSIPDAATIASKITNLNLSQAVLLSLNRAEEFLQGLRPIYEWSGPTWYPRGCPKSPSTSSHGDSGYDSLENPLTSSPRTTSPNLEAQLDTEAWVKEHTELTVAAPNNDPAILLAIPQQQVHANDYPVIKQPEHIRTSRTSWNVFVLAFVPHCLRSAVTTTKDAEIEAPFTQVATSPIEVESIEKEVTTTTTIDESSTTVNDLAVVAAIRSSEDSAEVLAIPTEPDAAASALLQSKPALREQLEVEKTILQDGGHDSGVELSSTPSDDESEVLIVQLPEELKEFVTASAVEKQLPTILLAPPNLKGFEKVKLVVYSDEYETKFSEPTAAIVSTRKVCAFGKCTAKCLDNPCYGVDQMIEYNPTITEDPTIIKTTRIYLDITGTAAIVHFPRSKGLRLLAQDLNSIVTTVIDTKELEDPASKYQFEINITRFIRSTTPFIIYSTSPISGFYRDLADIVEGFDPSERTQQMLTYCPGREFRVPNLFLGTKQEFKTQAERFKFSQDEKNIVTFLDAESNDDFLNQFEDFSYDAPPDRREEEESEYTEGEQIIRNQACKRWKESKKFALGATIADAKDTAVLYCIENAERICDDGTSIVPNHDQVHQTTQEEKDLRSWEDFSYTGTEMKGKTNSPEDKDRTVHRVVAWLSKDIGSYDALEDDLVSTCTCKGCVAAPMFADKVLSPTASALYDALVLAAKGANEQASNSTKTKGTYEFQLVNLCEDHASAHKKHIYLGTASEDIELRFSPCTQKLNITSPTITSCFELDISALPLTLVGTRAHVPNMPTVNCMIYSTKPIKKYTLDYTLPEIKGAPRQNNKELKAFLKENCAKYLDFAPYAVKYKTSLGNVGPKVLKCEVKILGPEVESEEENDE